MPKLVDTQVRRRLVAEVTLALIRQRGPATVTVIAETLGLLAQHLVSPAEGRRASMVSDR